VFPFSSTLGVSKLSRDPRYDVSRSVVTLEEGSCPHPSGVMRRGQWQDLAAQHLATRRDTRSQRRRSGWPGFLEPPVLAAPCGRARRPG